MQHCVFDPVFMRTSYVPRDAPQSTTNVPSELNDLIQVFSFTHGDSDITKGTVSHNSDEENSSFTDDLSDSGPLKYISSLTLIDEEDEMVKKYPYHDIPYEFLVSLSHNLLDVTTEDVKQFVPIHALKQMTIFQNDILL